MVMKPEYIPVAVLVSMLQEIGVIHKDNIVFYGRLINSHYDLNKNKTEIKYNHE